MARIEGVPMYYRMPVAALRPDLLQRFPRGASTLELIQQGLRTATTRRPFASAGDVITFQGDSNPYEVVTVARPDLASPAGRQAWEQHEGWNLNYVDANPSLRAQVYNPRAVQTVFRPLIQRSTEDASRMAGQALIASTAAPSGPIWAFGGARATPPDVLDLISLIGQKHAAGGGRIAHGGAPGADRAATRLVDDPEAMAIFLTGASDLRGPDPVYAGRRVFNSRQYPSWQEAHRIAREYEDPYRPGGRDYNARNVMVLLGPKLEAPRKRLVVWTPGGQDVGGTGHAIRVAGGYGIPVYNLADRAVRAGAERWLQG